LNTICAAEPPSRHPIRVLCVDDSRDITSILGRCIDHEPDMESAGSLETADDLAAEVEKRRVDVVLLDMTMPGKDPLEALREVKMRAKGARVIVFSGRDDPDALDSASEAGACGLLSKNAKATVILAAIRQMAESYAGDPPFGVWR